MGGLFRRAYVLAGLTPWAVGVRPGITAGITEIGASVGSASSGSHPNSCGFRIQNWCANLPTAPNNPQIDLSALTPLGTSGLSQRKLNGERAAGRAQGPAPTVSLDTPTPKESPRHSTSAACCPGSREVSYEATVRRADRCRLLVCLVRAHLCTSADAAAPEGGLAPAPQFRGESWPSGSTLSLLDSRAWLHRVLTSKWLLSCSP